MEMQIVYPQELFDVLMKDELADYYHKCKMAKMDFMQRHPKFRLKKVDAGIARKLNEKKRCRSLNQSAKSPII